MTLPLQQGDVPVSTVPRRSPPTRASGHVPALDGLRGIAILLVLFFHFPAPFSFMAPLTGFGWFGVDLFFVLSGYLITGILYDSQHNANYFRNFYARRSLRIFPLYYGFMILVLLVLPKLVNPYWLGEETLNGGVMPFFLYYTNYADVFGGWAPVSLGAFWSLAVEEHFYFFWPAFIRFTPKGRLILWCVIVAALALASRLVITAFKMTWLAAYYLTTSRADSLVIGAITAILVRTHPDWLKRWALRIGGIAAAILVAIAIWRQGLVFNDWPMRTFGYSLLALFFASVVWFAGNRAGFASRVLSNRFLVMFGTYSYCIYVCHLLVLTFSKRWVGPHLFPIVGLKTDAPLPLFAVSLIGTMTVAMLSWRFFERPILSLKSRFGSA
jgi:peptidoglycan/LPS O-acetylase OafA/YrhL